jgi:hypothetical protein
VFSFFSGYIKAHGLKYQTTLFPNGMVAGVFGTSSNNNDVGVLNLSRLTQHLERVLFPQFVMPGGLLPALYGDSVFLGHNYSTIISRYDPVGTVEEQRILRRLNFRMSGIRQSIEHMYGQLFNLFHLLKTPRQFKLYNNGEMAYRTGVVCFFLLNCYTCFNGSACNSMFNTFPPTIQEYLPVEEDLLLYIDDDNNIYDFYILDDRNA